MIDPRWTLSTSEVAERAGVSTNAVRYYEDYGIVHADRTPGNARRFTVDAVCRIKLAVAAQRVGLTLARSAEILGSIPPADPAPERWADAMQRLVDAGEERIAELRGVVEHYRDLDFIRS